MKTMKSMMFVLLMALAGCQGEDVLKLLKEHEWQLKTVQMDGKVVENPAELPVLFFSDSTSVYGSAGCNRFFGKYTADAKGNVTIQPEGATMMSCPDLEFEDRYLKALAQMKNFRISNRELTLKGEDGKSQLVYTWVDAE